MALSTLFIFVTVTGSMSSCRDSDAPFLLKGKFKNFNQGELYVYSLTGKGRIDTIQLREGKFSYENWVDDTLLMSVVFPNFSEIPVIAVPYTTVTMEGSASQLKKVTVKGTKDNDLLTKFRLEISEMTPPQAKEEAKKFISANPASAANLYLLNKYFLLTTEADYAQAAKLLMAMTKARPQDKRLQSIRRQIEGLQATKVGSQLPKFTATTTSGARVTKTDLMGTVNVVSVWASWNYESQRMQRELRKLKRTYGSRLKLLSICLDGSPAECKQQMERDSITWYTICDGTMWNHPLVSTLGINRVPDNVVVDNKGRIQARGLNMEDLKKRIEKDMK